MALFLRYAAELDSIVTPSVELAVDLDVKLGLASYPLGFVVILRKGMLRLVLDNALGLGRVGSFHR